MKRIFLFSALLISAVCAKAEDYIETYNVLSDDYVNSIQDAQIIRVINGGTVITPIFDETCPEQIKAPFAYACKIVEEYMPPCLPLKVQVSCGNLTGSSNGTISKVRTASEENFGYNALYNHVPMSLIKGVILAELGYDYTRTYLDYVPDVNFLTQDPDIEITYNEQRLDEISFSIDPDPGENYDFVSIAIRDLLIGLGISSNYRYNPTTKELLNPAREMTPFEIYIDKMLGNNGDPVARLANCDQGGTLATIQQNKS